MAGDRGMRLDAVSVAVVELVLRWCAGVLCGVVGAFGRSRWCGVVVSVCRHPSVVLWVSSLVRSVGCALQAAAAKGGGCALKLVLAIIDPAQQQPHGRCVERLVVDVRTPSVQQSLSHSRTATAEDGAAELRAPLCEALHKLSLCNALLSALPNTHPPCTFTLLLHTNHPDVLSPHQSISTTSSGHPHHPHHSFAPSPFSTSAASPSTATATPPTWLRTELLGGAAIDSAGGAAAGAAASTSSHPHPPAAWLIDIRSIRTASLEVEIYIQEAQHKHRQNDARHALDQARAQPQQR